jgi:hypothetical protein
MFEGSVETATGIIPPAAQNNGHAAAYRHVGKRSHTIKTDPRCVSMKLFTRGNLVVP